MTYKDSEIYNRFERIMSNIRAAGAKLKSKMEDSAQLVINAMERIESELIPAQRERDRMQGLLATEEMNGQTNPKTAAAAESSAQKYNKLKQSLSVLSKTGGLAVIQLEKRVAILGRKLRDLNNENSRYTEAFAHEVTPDNRKKTLRRVNNEIAAVSEELARLNSVLKPLRNTQGENGRLVVIDGNTKETADAAMQTAVAGYIEIEDMLGKIVVDIDTKRAEFEKLKEELSVLEEVRNSLNTDYIADAFYDSEIEAVFLTEMYEAMDTRNAAREASERVFLRGQLCLYIRDRAQATVRTLAEK